MKRLHIKRTDANYGIVFALGRFFEEVPVTPLLPYKSCMAYRMENQEELKIYKVGRILNRKNAKRTLYKRFLAKDDKEAMSTFLDILKNYEGSGEDMLQLLSGDWKELKASCKNDLITIL